MNLFKSTLFSFLFCASVQAEPITIVVIGNDLPCLTTAYSLCRDLEKKQDCCNAEVIVIGNCQRFFGYRLGDIREIFVDCEFHERFHPYFNILNFTCRNNLTFHNHFNFFYDRSRVFSDDRFVSRREEELEFLANPHLFNLRREAGYDHDLESGQEFETERLRKLMCCYFQDCRDCKPHTIFCDRPVKEIIIDDHNVCQGVLLNKGCFIRADLVIFAHGSDCNNLLASSGIFFDELFLKDAVADLFSEPAESPSNLNCKGFNDLGIYHLVVMPNCTSFCFNDAKALGRCTGSFFELSGCSFFEPEVVCGDMPLPRYPADDLGDAPADYFSDEMNFPDSVDYLPYYQPL